MSDQESLEKKSKSVTSKTKKAAAKKTQQKTKKAMRQTQIPKVLTKTEKVGLDKGLEEDALLFDLEKVKELSRYELKQILSFLDPLHDEEKYQAFLKIYEEKEEPLVQKARLGLRVWSFFYEKLIIRIISLAWVFFAFGNIKEGLNELALNEAEISQQVFTMIVFMGLLVLNFSWRAFVAMYESKKKNFGSMFFRRHLSIRVVGKDGAPISFFRAFLRGLFRLFPLSM